MSFIAPDAKVLVVDDINTNLKVAEGLLSAYKIQVNTCRSGIEAVKMVKENEYDIVFMDHMMPEMDGMEATLIIRTIKARGVKRKDYYQKLPIIALTANCVAGAKELFLTNGFSDFLLKPIEIPKLANMLKKWLPSSKQKKHTAAKMLPEEPDFEIAGLDVNRGVFMTGGSVANYKKTLAVFCKDSIRKTTELKDCLAGNQLKLYTTYVHALKSAAANIGAKKLSEKAKALEDAAKKKDIAFLEKYTTPLLQEMEMLLRNINGVILNEPDAKLANMPDMQFLCQQLAKVREALEKMDIRTIDITMDALHEQKWDKKTKHALEVISEKVLLFEYDEAVEFIDQIFAAK